MATIRTPFAADALTSSLAHDCQSAELKRVDNPANAIDWSDASGSQGYQVYRCDVCRDYWGMRYQSDAGTGSDDRSLRFGPDPRSVQRHN